METNSQEHNSANLAFVKTLKDNGAKTVFTLTIPDHRLPTWNQILGGKLRDRIARKKQEKAAFQKAFDSDSLFTPTERD